MLKRMADRIAAGPDGNIRVLRYGMWGTSALIEKRCGKYYVVISSRKEIEFPSLAEAEVYLKELVSSR